MNEKDFLSKHLEIIRERLARRKGDRLIAETKFSYKLQGKPGIYQGLSLNISSYGMSFQVDTPLFEGEKLLFNFRLNNENVVINGVVVRMEGREASVEFLMTDDERERFIRLFNQEILNDNSNIRISIKDFKKRLD